MTFRCARSQFRLRPDEQRAALFAFWLATAQRHCPNVQIVAACQMSSHGHLVVVDEDGELSRFMMIFLGGMAKALNALDGTRGQVWERRFTPIEIVDDGALVDRIAYTVANPTQADLVTTYRSWPGVCDHGRRDEDMCIEGAHVHVRALERARRRAEARGDGEAVDVETFTERATLRLARTELAAEVREAIAERERQAAVARGGRQVLGARRAAEAGVFDGAPAPKRSPRPSCHASTRALREMFAAGWSAFCDAYRRASSKYRSGELGISFPAHCFRPWLGITDDSRLGLGAAGWG